MREYMKKAKNNNSVETVNGRYIKAKSYQKAAYSISLMFVFVYYVLPQYFGIKLPFFDLTAQRMFIILFFLYIVEKESRAKLLLNDIRKCSLLPFIAIYLFILLYTAILRSHMGTFLYSFIEFLAFFLFIYAIKNSLGMMKTMEILVILSYVLCILGIIEFIMGTSPFSYMETISGLYRGGMVRSGTYRIMGPCNHSLGYGLVLITMLPFACYNAQKDELDILYHWPLFLLIAVNVFLTGSRSTLAVWGLEVVLFFLFCSKHAKKRFIVYFISGLAVFVFVIALTYRTSFGRYIMLQLTSVIDEIIGTNYAASFGADANTLENSANYREQLLDIFSISWLNPWLGRGSGYVFQWYHNGYTLESIDNFYIANYIRYGYPGMIAYIIMIVYTLLRMLWSGIKRKSGLALCMFIGTLCYFINLWWLDTLQTIKYVYILFAFYYAVVENGLEVSKVNISRRYLRQGSAGG